MKDIYTMPAIPSKYFYFFSFLFYLITSTHSLCHDVERSALLQFKGSFSINMTVSRELSARPKMASWKLEGAGEENGECCSWDGVECHERTGHVIGIDLGSSFLYGSINSTSSLFTLVHLRRLNLADNNFKYSLIPSAISRLSRLSTLNLSASVFAGPIPSEIFKLSRLVSLELSMNIDPWSSQGLLRLEKTILASLVHNLPNLRALYLGNVFINSTVPETLANMTTLTELSLHDCGLYGEFPRNIFLLPNLQIVWLFNNKNLMGSLPEFHQRSSITRLEISTTSFSGPIPASIANLTELTDLVLSFSYIDGGRLLWLGKLTKLTHLDLGGINLKGLLPSSLANLTQLNFLGLSSNNFVGPIPQWIMNMTQLTFFDLSRNQFQGQIPSSFSGLKNLQILNLVSNNLSGIVEANVFFNIKNLSQLLLSGNHISFLTSNVTDAFIPKFALLGLGSCNLIEIPEFLKFQDELEVLSLTENRISEIPDWMFNRSEETFNTLPGSDRYPILLWARLRILDLRNNMIQGPIPIPPPKTSFYYVSDNRFTGEIPLMMCNLSFLSVFDLSNNNLTGTIPLCLGNVSSSLTVLNFRANNLRGIIPNTFTEKCSLRMINLSQNRLKGHIPSSLANCSSLEILDLGNNLLEDSFPSWLGDLLELQVLVLSSNRLYGEIQSPANTSTSFQKLRIIDVSKNVLTGYLPVQYIKQWNAMKIPLVDPLIYMELLATIYVLNMRWQGIFEYSMTITNKGVKTEYVKILDILIAIDFSSNKFIGEIPNSIGSLKGIQLLNFSNNNLIGHIPLSIGNLTQLESLDLSQNKLSGEIPQELAQLNFLAFLNVSFNHLVGSIPLGKQFNTFTNNSYEGNLALCGDPLSLACGASNGQRPSTAGESDDYEFLTRTEWIVMVTAFGGWMIVGFVFGQTLTTKNHDWFVDRFGKRPKNWQSIAMLGEERRNPNM